MPNGKMKFAVFMMADSNYHIAGWRHPESYADAGSNIQRWIEFARILERGKLDMLFVADTIGVPGASDPQYLTSHADHRQARAVHLARGLVVGHAQHRLGGDLGDRLQRAVFRRPGPGVARSHHRRPGGLESGDRRKRRGRRQFQRRHPCRARRPLRARRGVRRCCPRAVGKLRPRCISARQIVGTLSRSRQASHAQSQGQVFLGEGAAERVAAAARPSGDRPGRHVGAGAKIVCRGWPTWCSPPSRRSRTPRRSMRT